MRRRFSQSEKNRLYAASDGRCAQCGAPLQPGWHADHVYPYAAGGKTELDNGQALCPTCNQEKGARVMNDEQRYKGLRPFQKMLMHIALDKAIKGEKEIIIDVHPGSGKTLGALLAADTLMRHGYIDKVIALVPRLNLAQQMELDSNDFVRSQMRTVLNPLYHRENIEPMIRGNESGYVTTYASVMSDPNLHLRQMIGRRVLLICDEQQQLGVDNAEDGQGTRSAEIVERMAECATMVLAMSGTSYRSDEQELLFSAYTSPDENGVKFFRPDVTASYRDGVALQYLRRFEVQYIDGGARWKQVLSGETEILELSQMNQGLYKVIRSPEYWQPVVDQFIELCAVQRRMAWNGFRDLIAANNINHAREIKNYINSKHPNVKTLLAVSADGKEAHEALQKFKEGKHEILITVSMAYVGYDYKPISHVLALTSFRSEAYLRQLVARALRVTPEIPFEKQCCYLFAPNDPQMQIFAEKLRSESAAGLRDIQHQRREKAERATASQEQMGYTEKAWAGGVSAKGYHPEGDADEQLLSLIEHERREMGIAINSTALIALMRKVEEQKSTPPPAVVRPAMTSFTQPRMTMQEQERAARQRLSKLTRKLDWLYFGEGASGAVNKLLYEKYKKPVNQCSLSEIHERIAFVEMKIKEAEEGGNYDDEQFN